MTKYNYKHIYIYPVNKQELCNIDIQFSLAMGTPHSRSWPPPAWPPPPGPGPHGRPGHGWELGQMATWSKWDFGDILYNFGYRSDFIPFIAVKGHKCTVPFCF